MPKIVKNPVHKQKLQLLSVADDFVGNYLKLDGSNANTTIDIQGQDLVNVGNFGIGTDTPSTTFDVSDGTNSYFSVNPSAGTTTIRGKSTYNALGSDLVTNGAFATSTDWTYGAGWAWDAGGYALHTAGNTATLSQAVSVTNGKTYRVEFEIKNFTTGTISVSLNGVSTGAVYKTKDKFAPVITAGASGGLVFTPSSDFDGAIDNVIVKEMTANEPAIVLYDEAGNIRSEQRSLDAFSLGKNALKYLSIVNSLNIAIGDNALGKLADSYRNIAIGTSAAASQSAGIGYNTAIGFGALTNNEAGTQNTAIGYATLQFSRASNNNVAIGASALAVYVGGNNDGNKGNNVAIGTQSLGNLTTGYNNYGFGTQAMYYATTAIGNVSIGGIQNITTGNYNVGIGAVSGNSISTGGSNVSIGAYANTATTTEANNTAIGVFAFGGLGGAENTVIGAGAGYSNLTAKTGVNYNTLIGRSAGRSLIAGSSSNVFIGYQAGYNETGSNRLYISNTSTTTPLIYGLFSGADAGLTVNSQNTAGVPLIVKGIASQTANLTEWQNSSGTVLSGIDQRGVVFSDLGKLGSVYVGKTCGNASSTAAAIGIGYGALAGVVTGGNNVAVGTYSQRVVTSGNSNFSLGAYSLYSLTTGSGNVAIGNYALTLSNGGANIAIGNIAGQLNTAGNNNIFIGAGAGTNNLGSSNVFIGYSAGSNETGSNKLYIANSSTSTPLIYGDFATGLTIHSQATTAIGLTVKGIASQTGNLQEWQNSGGTAGSAITSDTNKLLLGTGTNNTTASRLFITETSTDTSEISQFYAQRLMTNPLTNRGGMNTSIQVAHTSGVFSGQNIGAICQAWIRNTNTQNWTSAGTVNQLGLVGLEARVEVRSGATGTISWLTGLVSDGEFNSNSTATVTNYAGFKIFEPVNAGSLVGFTNNYGLYVANMSAATNNYAIYTNTGKVHFGDKVEFTQTDGNEYIDSEADGYLTIGATSGVLINKMIYGSMYGDDIAHTVTISSAGVYYAITAGLTGGESNGMTFQNNRELLVTVAGKYRVTWSMSLECGSAGQYVEGSVMINSTAQENTVGASELPSANKKVNVAGSGIISLAVNDVVKLCVENETGTNNIIVDHANIELLRIGN